MLEVTGNRVGLDCAGNTRRDFLRAGALGTTGLLLPDLLKGRAVAAAGGASPPDTSVIWLWLSGGPTQMETFDPKPENTAEFRSVVGSLRTNVPGIEIGGLFPKVAQQCDKLTIVRSMAHQQADHAAASHWVMTGHDYPPAANGAPAVSPSLGSMVARSRGATAKDSGLPTYVTTDHLYAGGGAWLGKAYNPFHVRDEGVGNMTPRFAQERLQDRQQLLKSLDRINRRRDSGGTMQALDSFEAQAFDLLRGTSPTAFDLSREDPQVRDAYGPALGQNLLLARRLCEAGVGFVTVWYGGWDSHGTNPSVGHGTIEQEMHKLAPSFDHSVAALLQDIYQRGLDKKILVVITGEFGRTPWLDAQSGGRGHWPHLCTLALSGGGIKVGQIVGQSSAKADVPKSAPISPQDLMATVFQHLGMPLDLTYNDAAGRPIRMLENGTPISELF